MRKYRQEHKQYFKKYAKECYLKYQEERQLWQKEYFQNNKREYKEYRQQHKKERNDKLRQKYVMDSNYKLEVILRSRIHKALKRNSKRGTTVELLGCPIKFLKKYLGKRFEKGMTWQNQGLWHVDHIIPCKNFNLSKKSEQKKCFHYTNLQPLWAKENYIKGAK